MKIKVNNIVWDMPAGIRLPHPVIVAYAYKNPIRDYTVDYAVGGGRAKRLPDDGSVTIVPEMKFTVRPA